MLTRCPGCGAGFSLEVLIENEAARQALDAIVKISGGLLPPIVRYLALFRTEKRQLGFDKVARLLQELQPDLQRRQIIRNGQTYAAPPEAWGWAIEQVIMARDNGTLKLPLKTHSYLYQVLSNWKPGLAPALPATGPVTSDPAPQPPARRKPMSEDEIEKNRHNAELLKTGLAQLAENMRMQSEGKRHG